MVALEERPVLVPVTPGDVAGERGDATPRPGVDGYSSSVDTRSAVRTAHALWWRWLPWTAPRLRLGARLRPQTRLELALCALFRCRREWPAGALVARLAQAPAGSDDPLALIGRTGADAPRSLGRGAAWDAMREWLERGVLIDVAPARPAANRDLRASLIVSRSPSDRCTRPARTLG